MILPVWNLFYLFAMGGRGTAALATTFWIWMLIDCLMKESSEGNDKIAWVLFILLVPFISSLIYYIVRRPERMKALGQ